jgi:hypothetical protein
MLPLRGSGFASLEKGEILKEEKKEYGHCFYMIRTMSKGCWKASYYWRSPATGLLPFPWGGLIFWTMSLGAWIGASAAGMSWHKFEICAGSDMRRCEEGGLRGIWSTSRLLVGTCQPDPFIACLLRSHSVHSESLYCRPKEPDSR